ncbi:hypothetical protein P3T76_006357 [Phytophthora citrophthora]|uniref:Uncharacterized protein n=1 Tax=Phytophthora citrophthora TaxID=4793 RepID=A0AAD9LM84_9STRA|nr:hypothetical protein P3T76_006357 [Phytophthora citrophthora]
MLDHDHGSVPRFQSLILQFTTTNPAAERSLDSPSKTEKLVQDQKVLETGRDGLPQEIWDGRVKNKRKILYMFMFLNDSVLWAYYSCLSAQDFYEVQFADSNMESIFLTILFTSWPIVVGHGLQMGFGLDKKITRQFRVHGYAIFMLMAILTMVFSAFNFSNQKTGAHLVLICFACIGMLKPEGRESGGALMVFCLFFRLTAIGIPFSDQGWLGLYVIQRETNEAKHNRSKVLVSTFLALLEGQLELQGRRAPS